MARTRTAGIRIDGDGRRIIDKEHRGVGIYLRLGPISQEDAEQQLTSEVDRIDAELRYNANHRHRFVDCAERYLAESKHRRSVDVAAWHVRLLTPYIGMLEIHRGGGFPPQELLVCLVRFKSCLRTCIGPRGLRAWVDCACILGSHAFRTYAS